jgi:uncharacterized protein YqgC (DUF456 family)
MDSALTVLLVGFGLIVAIAGFLGCLIPILPGPPLSFVALIILSLAKAWKPFSVTFILVMAALTVLVTALDYVVPVAGARRYGASKFGVWGSFIGLIIGLFAFPPLGMFIGGVAGAVVGELLAGRKGKEALRAGWGALIGNVLTIGLKMSLSAVMVFFYVKGMF